MFVWTCDLCKLFDGSCSLQWEPDEHIIDVVSDIYCFQSLLNTHPPGCVDALAPDGQDAAVSLPWAGRLSSPALASDAAHGMQVASSMLQQETTSHIIAVL